MIKAPVRENADLPRGAYGSDADRTLPDKERSGIVGRSESRSMGDRVSAAIDQGGVPQLLRRGLNRLTSPWVEFGSVTFFRRRLDGGPEVARARAGLSVLHASLAGIALVLEVSDPRRTPGMVQERLRRGDLCFLALDAAGRPIHSGWATTVGAHVPELERDIVLRTREAYLYDAFTPPSRRGTGAFGFVLDHLFTKLQSFGARVVYSYVRRTIPRGSVRLACGCVRSGRSPTSGSTAEPRWCSAALETGCRPWSGACSTTRAAHFAERSRRSYAAIAGEVIHEIRSL